MSTMSKITELKTGKSRLEPGTDPRVPFFLGITMGNLDGTMSSIGGEGVEGLFATYEEAEVETGQEGLDD